MASVDKNPMPKVDASAETLTQLNHLKASATKEYSLKNWIAAADLYSEAVEIQAEINGEMAPENAELLYQYGRCLYKVAVSNSDVLGGKVAGGEEPKKKKRKTAPANGQSDALKSGEEKMAEETLEAVVEEKDGAVPESKKDGATDKPFFQITGDENWTDSEDEEDDEGAEGEAEEEDDDFAIAYEILDVARVLLSRQIEELDATEVAASGKGKGVQSDTLSPEKRGIMERLADTHDLQAEISLENERFTDAVTDSQSALDLKLKLFPTENSLIAEAHFKVSLALEFASVTTVQTEGDAVAEEAAKTPQVDEEARQKSAMHMDKAIESCKLRVQKETAAMEKLSEAEKKDRAALIKDVQEMIQDMEGRVSVDRSRDKKSYTNVLAADRIA